MKDELLVLGFLAVALPAHAAQESMAVLPLRAPDVDGQIARAIDGALIISAHRIGPHKVVSAADINAQLGVEAMKDAMGCDDVKCAAEIAGAWGTRFLMAGDLSALGDTLILNLSLIDTRNQEVQGRGRAKVVNDEMYLDYLVAKAMGQVFAKSVAPFVCPVGRSWTGTECQQAVQCPQGARWNGSACVAQVACPTGFRWDGQACVAAVQCQSGSRWDGRACVPVSGVQAFVPNAPRFPWADDKAPWRKHRLSKAQWQAYEDHYRAAQGARYEPLKPKEWKQREDDHHLLLEYFGYRRQAQEVLAEPAAFATWRREIRPKAGEWAVYFAYVGVQLDAGRKASPFPAWRKESYLGSIAIRTAPAGASIRLGRRTLGPAPAVATALEPGTYEVSASLPGHLTRRTAVVVQNQRRSEVELSLPKPGSIRLLGAPKGASVWLNGQPAGDANTVLDGLEPGTHRVSVKRRGYEGYTETIELPEGEEVSMQVAMLTLEEVESRRLDQERREREAAQARLAAEQERQRRQQQEAEAKAKADLEARRAAENAERERLQGAYQIALDARRAQAFRGWIGLGVGLAASAVGAWAYLGRGDFDASVAAYRGARSFSPGDDGASTVGSDERADVQAAVESHNGRLKLAYGMGALGALGLIYGWVELGSLPAVPQMQVAWGGDRVVLRGSF